ncbi:hypothetical protein CAAN1_01S10286 [[Candida] anglica]|uniref:MICOS complex subunit n=1 Tax=[Candida] anglica TaxID=148631 RepID=A0ABP0EPK9_9ASCO
MTKRGFYEDDDLVVNKPGFNAEITKELKEQESSHGNVSFIQGMSIRTTPILEEYTNIARHYLHEKWSYYGAELETQKSALSNEVTSVKQEIRSVVREPVLPNLIYVLTATLSGSILVNRRALPVRFITPLLFGGASLSYFMPKTFSEISSCIDSYEAKHLPEVRSLQTDLKKQYQEAERATDQQLDCAKKTLTSAVHDARVFVAQLLSEPKK